jgi:hypothetical protein
VITDKRQDRTRRLISLGLGVIVLVWSALELLNLTQVHTVGAEVYGVLVAAVAVVTGALSLWLLASGRRRLVATIATLMLWAVIALGGVAGSIAHVVGPSDGHGPVDSRPRPAGAPLIFTALGIVGGASLVYGQRLLPLRRREP